MAQEALDFIISARDEATRVLQGVGQQLEMFGQAATRGTEQINRQLATTTRTVTAFDNAMAQSARGVRALALPLISELSPALGRTSGEMVRVLTGAAALGTGFGALTLAVAGTAGVLAGEWISASRRAQEAQLDFRRALQSPEIGDVTSKLATQSKELRDLRDRLREVNQEITAIDPRKVEQLRGPFSPGARRAQLERDRAVIEGQISQLREREAADLTGATVGQAFRAGEQLDRDRARQALEILDRVNRGEFRTPLIQDPIARSEAELRASLAPQIELLRSQGLTDQARVLQAFPGLLARDARITRFQQGAPVNPFETAQGQEAERRARAQALVEEAEADEARIREFQQQAPVNPFETAAGQAAERKAIDQEQLRLMQEQEQVAGRIFVANVQMLDVQRHAFEIAGQMTPELNAQLILRERDLLLSQEKLTDQEKGLINARAEVALLEQMVRLDPLAGLSAGFAESAARSREWGSELRQLARETDRTMSQTFSDGLFNLFTGRKGQDLGKQFAESLLRSVTDVVGRQLSSSVSGIFSQGLQAVRGVVPSTAVAGGGGGFDILSLIGGSGAAPTTLSPTGLPVGQLVMTEAGVGQVTPTGAVQILQSGSTGGSFDVGGDTAISAVKGLYGAYQGFTGVGANYAVGGLSGALFGVPTVVTGGATIAVPVGTSGYALAELGAVGVDATLGAGTAGFAGSGGSAAGVGGAGLSLTGAATGVLAAVALGFTIYGGLTQEQTAQNIAINAVSGAISGAVLGAIIGSIIPGVGTVIGGVVGAIAGGAAAGGTTGLKAPRGLTTGERSAEIGRRGAENLQSAISRASSIEDMVAIFNTRWAPNGEVQILTVYEGTLYWTGDQDDPGGQPATPELMVIPEFLDALDVRVGQTGAPETNATLVTAFRAKRDELLETLSAIPFGILESDRGAGVTRRTYLPFQKIYGLEKGQQQLFGSSEFYRRDLGGEDDTIAFLLDRLREYSVRKDVDLTRTEFLFR
jgi:hypothetical protein